MSSTSPHCGRLAAAVIGVGAGVLTLTGVAAAAPPAGTNLLTNGNFNTGFTVGSTPTGWSPVNQGAAPYKTDAGFDDQSTTSQYPAPAGGPDAAGEAVEDYFDGGSAGVGGEGGTQTLTGITQLDHPQVTFSDSYTETPGNVSWVFSGLEVALTSGATTYDLVYVNQWAGVGTGAPTTAQVAGAIGSATAQTALVTLSPIASSGTWVTSGPRDLDGDVASAFGLSSFSVTSVTPIVLEDATADASPYPNYDAFFEDLSLAEGSVAPPTSVPESPLAVAVPVVGIGVGGAVLLVVRRRRRLR